jgi:hypothetical protein
MANIERRLVVQRRLVVFVDANIYLDLYRLAAGQELLSALEEQKRYLFVSTQIADEVLRNKLQCAAEYFTDRLKELSETNTAVPDHLLGITDENVQELRKVFKEAAKKRDELASLSEEALERISRSDDDVSRRLGKLFERAIPATPQEIERARQRKEKGNPPGKPNNPLGDQIVWEQLLSFCAANNCEHLWIVTRDKDHVITYRKQPLLNPFLRSDLDRARGKSIEVWCFGDLLKALKHFAATAKVSADKLPTGEQAEKIEKEIEALQSEADVFGSFTRWYLNQSDPALAGFARRHLGEALAGEDRSFLNPKPPSDENPSGSNPT